MISFIRFGRVSEAGILPHGPQPPAVHGRLHAARERELARLAEVARVVERRALRRIEVLDRDAGVGLEAILPQLHVRSMVTSWSAMRSSGSVSACTSAAVTPGASSRKTSPPSRTSITASSVMI